ARRADRTPERPNPRVRRAQQRGEHGQNRALTVKPAPTTPGAPSIGSHQGRTRTQNAGSAATADKRKPAPPTRKRITRPPPHHGKEGVDGSSPSQGFAMAPQTGLFVLADTALRSACSGMESVMERRDPETSPVLPLASSRHTSATAYCSRS